MTKRVLCLSGGGAKGYAQIQVLKQLELEYKKPLCEVYDLIAGTSVGAINSALIASGKYTMDELDKIYPDVLKRVFHRNWYRLATPKYQRKYFEEQWNNLIGSSFLMGDVKTKLMLTSVDFVEDINHFFKSWHIDDSCDKLVDVVCRSFAAPFYFGHIVDDVRKKVWSDGGVGNANLPLQEVKTQVESFGWYDSVDCNNDRSVQIDAIGCLYSTCQSKFEVVSKNRWIHQIFDYMKPLSGGFARVQSRLDQVRTMEYLSKNNKNIKFRYWDKEIPEKYDELDGVKYLEQYKVFGIEMAMKPLINVV